MRFLLVVLALLGAPVAALAQEQDVAAAVTALSANWRPVTSLSTAAFQAACAGATEEIDAVDAALPPVLTPESLARVRSLRGLLIMPAGGEAGDVFLFAPANLDWLTSGFARVTVIDTGEGFLGLRDAAGLDVALQRGAAGEHPVLRLRGPDNEILNFVACAPIL